MLKEPAFPLRIHNPLLKPHVKERYTRRDLAALEEKIRPALELRLTAGGLLKAAERPQAAGGEDPTNYNAVWVRDSVWGYYGLLESEGGRAEALRGLLALLGYMSSAEQRGRMTALIQDPSLREGVESPMHVPHIRFDAAAFERGAAACDVMIDGKPQSWNHKQNDALGLFLKATYDALLDRSLALETLKPEHWEALTLLPAYLDTVDFAAMEDAGAWEEIERLNSSSVGIVTAALESYAKALTDRALASPLVEGARRCGVAHALALSQSTERVARLIDRGYACLTKQLERGESPGYEKDNPRYRVSDAALLSLIYPARPARLNAAQLERVLEHVGPLVGEIGVKRYLGDTYQCAGYWQRDTTAACTDDFSSESDFVSRRQGFAPESEAQWFFDSWISKAAGVLHEMTKDDRYARLQICFFNRAVGQITPPESVSKVATADGTQAAGLACPESYNVLLPAREFAPSPITPLNWAKASLRIALQALNAGAPSS